MLLGSSLKKVFNSLLIGSSKCCFSRKSGVQSFNSNCAGTQRLQKTPTSFELQRDRDKKGLVFCEPQLTTTSTRPATELLCWEEFGHWTLVGNLIPSRQLYSSPTLNKHQLKMKWTRKSEKKLRLPFTQVFETDFWPQFFFQYLTSILPQI